MLKPKITIIIVNYNTDKVLKQALEHLFIKEPELVGKQSQTIIIDNASPQGFSQEIFFSLSLPNLKIIKNKTNVGFARAVNQGLKLAQGKYILLLNPDILVKDQAISQLVDYLEKNKFVGLVGPQMVFVGGCFQASSGYFPTLSREFLRLTGLYKIFGQSTLLAPSKLKPFDLNTAQFVDWLSGGCLLIRRQVIKEIGVLDKNYFLGGEDIDFCYQAKKAGWQVVYLPATKVEHYHGLSSGGTNTIARQKYDRDGLLYFWRKNWPNRRLAYIFLLILYNLKILTFKLMFWLKEKTTLPLSPKDATIAITYRCNSRCQMCNIWRIENPPDISLKMLAQLSPTLKYVNVSGGEPFLHPDLPTVIKTIKQAAPKAQIIISTNGLATNLIIKQMEEVLKIDPQVGVRVSLDGLAEVHNKIRGIANIFSQAIDTIKRLQQIGVSNLGLSFTILDDNANQLPLVYDLARQLGVEMAIALVQNSDIYFNTQANVIKRKAEIAQALDYVISKELKSWRPKQWLRAYYDFGLKVYAQQSRRLLPSGAGFDSLFVDPEGKVYPSNLINLEMGNLGQNSLSQIWSSPQARAVREKIKKEKITESWIICTIRGEMKRNWFKVLAWVSINKLRVLFGAQSFKV